LTIEAVPPNEKSCFEILKIDLFVFARYSGPPTPILIRRPKTKPSGTGQVARFQVKFARQTPRWGDFTVLLPLVAAKKIRQPYF